MQKDTMQESARARTQCLWVHGRSLWNEADASLSFDWPGTQICFRVRGSPTEVNMLASIGDDVLAVYANGRWQRKIGPSHGGRETYLLVRDAPADCTIRMVKLSEPNMSNPITIYDVWTGLYSLQDGVAPSICPLDISGDRPDAESTFECVGDSDTSALYNVATSHSATALDSSSSDIEKGWPFFLAESLGVAPPMVVALSGVGVHAGPHRPESLSDYYPRMVCCWKDAQNSAPRDSISAGSSRGPLCVLVFVGGNDFVSMPRDPPSEQSSFMQGFVSAHQDLLRAIRHRRPSSPIVSLYGDADSCSACRSVEEQKFISSNMQTAVLESVAGLGGASHGFLSCMVQPHIRPECSDWSHDMHWNPTGHQKFSTGLKKALLALAQREGVQHRGEQWFPGMGNLAAMLSLPLSQAAAAVRASAASTLSANVSAQDVPHKSALHSVKDGGVSALQIAGGSLLHSKAMENDAEATALLAEDERCLVAVDSAVVTLGELFFRRVTPLHLAAFAGHPSVTLALLQSHAFAPFVNLCAQEVTVTGPRAQWSALHVAVMKGHASVAKCLLHSKTFSQDLISAVTVCGTALHMACFDGNAEVAQLLLDHDRFTAVNAAMACDSDFDGHTALTLAITKGHERTVCLLLRHRRLHAVGRRLPQGSEAAKQGSDALQQMAGRGMEEAVQLYLDVHACKKPGAFVRLGAVRFAAVGGQERTLQILTAHAAVDTPTELAHTQLDDRGIATNALHLACYFGHMCMVQCILRLNGCEAAINAQSGKARETALHIAAFQGHEDIASCLLQSDSFTALNAVDWLEKAALHVACEMKFESIAVEIIRHPKFNKHNAVCSYGNTALMLAKKSNLRLVIDALAQI